MTNQDQLLSISYLLSTAWQMFKVKWLQLLKVQLVGILAMIVGAIVIILVAILLAAIAASSHVVMVGIAVVAIVVGIIALLLISSWINLAQIYILNDSHSNYLRSAWPGALGLLGVTVLVGLATVGGLLLSVIPGIIIGVWFSQGQYVYALEGLKGKAALGRSRQLIVGRWWKAFALVALPSVVVYIVSSLLDKLIQQLNLSSGDVISVVVTGLLNIAISLYIICYSYQVFLSLKATQPQVIIK
jgi:hypothetical protein